LLLMSATLDSRALSTLLDDAPVIRCQGRQYPVETHYLAKREPPPSAARIAHIVRQALATHTGNLLIFLPGLKEIRALQAQLEPELESGCRLAPLYGGLDLREQQKAIAAPPEGQRKIVLSTSIAETSLTIEGISIVVDSGLERRAEMNPRSGMTRLVTVAASRASADQRRGRAGRLGPGHCYRLWSKVENGRHPAFSTPEIALADLSPLALEMAQWGVSDPTSLCWLDPPPARHWAQASRLLQSLDIFDRTGRLTSHGHSLASLGLHPRIGHMLVTANQLGAGRLACDIAALLQERSPFPNAARETDFGARLSLLDQHPLPRDINGGIIARVRKQRRAYRQQLKPLTTSATLSAGAICALAYPDRIARQRGNGSLSYKLSGGGAATFFSPNALSTEPWLVVTELDGREREAHIFSAVAVSRNELETLFREQLLHQERLLWDRQQRAVVSERVTLLGELILHREPAEVSSEEEATQLLLQAIQDHGLDCLPWSPAASSYLQRLRFLQGVEGLMALPDFSPAALLDTLPDWLGPWVEGKRKFSQLQSLDLYAILRSRLSWEQQQRVDKLAPTHLTVPSGSRIRLQYHDEKPPVLAVRLQEMFSCTTTPTVAGGRVPVLVHLLSPARRPVQITDDLAGFWAGSYQAVKKEMKGRYPKHHWPDDPANTPAHATVKPR